MSSSHQVGIVVVSHSRALANAALDLAREMVPGQPVRIEVAAGLDDSTLGTDAVAVKEAIEAVDGPDGVVVLMDLGSAVLSAELALDLLDDPAVRERVVLSAAPIVEGLVVAAVAASGGAARDEIAAEAAASLLGKQSHIGGADGVADEAQRTDADITATFTVGNAHGLHARPAARLVARVREFDATLTLTNLTTGAGPVAAASVSRVATLGAARGHELLVTAAGPQARRAVDQVLAFAARGFDDPDTERAPGHPAAERRSPTGPLGVSPGIAIGPLRRFALPELTAHDDEIADAGEEWGRVTDAVARVRRDIGRTRDLTAREVGADEGGIFDAQLVLLADEEILGSIKERVDRGEGAFASCSATFARIERELSQLSDGYLRERAADVRAVADQVLRVLCGAGSALTVGEGVLVARDLTATQAASLDAGSVHGVVLAAGSATSHAAILVRSRAIPLVVSAGAALLEVPDGTTVVMDGAAADVLIDPPESVIEGYRVRADALEARRSQDLEVAHQPARSRDGTSVSVAANVGSLDDARTASASGADEVGLVRTEFLFLERETPPTVEEQVQHYSAIATAVDGRRITFRTLDVGGDKPLPYVPMPAEDNPFLGVRGLRLAMQRPELMDSQLEAIIAVARHTPVNVMFPMISTVDELREARAAMSRAAGGSPPEGLGMGMMVEVPAAALKIESFLPHLDFVSVGTNDLTQYTMAAERGNPGVSRLGDPLDPAVLRLIDQVCRACRGRALVAVCGEVAADPDAVPLLVGLGVRELSVAPRVVPEVKARVRELDLGECESLAEQTLAMDSAEDVRALVRSSSDC